MSLRCAGSNRFAVVAIERDPIILVLYDGGLLRKTIVIVV